MTRGPREPETNTSQGTNENMETCRARGQMPQTSAFPFVALQPQGPSLCLQHILLCFLIESGDFFPLEILKKKKPNSLFPRPPCSSPKARGPNSDEPDLESGLGITQQREYLGAGTSRALGQQQWWSKQRCPVMAKAVARVSLGCCSECD